MEDQIYQTFQVWLDSRIGHHMGNLQAQFQLGKCSEIKRAIASDWEDLLNFLQIKRIEHHLPKRPVKKDHIRILDPFRMGMNKNRDLEMSRETAIKILTLGIPR